MATSLARFQWPTQRETIQGISASVSTQVPQHPPFFDLRISSPMDALGFPCLFPCFFVLFDDTGGEAHAGFVKKFVAAQVVMMRACQHENIAQLFGVFQVQGSCGGFLGARRQIADIHRFFGCCKRTKNDGDPWLFGSDIFTIDLHFWWICHM